MNPARKRVLGVAIGVVPLSWGADSGHDTVLAPAVVVWLASIPEIMVWAALDVWNPFPESTNTYERGTERVQRHDPFKVGVVVAITVAALAMSGGPYTFRST